MGRDNHNAGMHFIRYPKKNTFDDLAYYDRNSEQGLQNRRYEHLTELETLGIFDFVKYVGFIYVLIMNGIELPVTYKVYLYDENHEKDLKRISTTMRLCDSQNLAYEILVRVHDKQRVIYINSNEFKEGLLDNKKPYKLFDKYMK